MNGDDKKDEPGSAIIWHKHVLDVINEDVKLEKLISNNDVAKYVKMYKGYSSKIYAMPEMASESPKLVEADLKSMDIDEHINDDFCIASQEIIPCQVYHSSILTVNKGKWV